MEKPPDGPPPPQDPLAHAQLEKLQLEIESLRKKSKWETFLQVAPLATAVIAVIGFFFGIYQYQNQQEKDRVQQEKDRITREVDQRLRLQDQWRTGSDNLLKFTQDPEVTISRASFLFGDLKNLLESPINETQKMSDLYPDYKRQLTQSLVKLIISDSDFDKQPRDVRFAATALERWEDYVTYLKENPNILDSILYKYVRALRSLRDKNPGYFQSLRLDPTGRYRVKPEEEQREGEETLYQHFSSISEGFKDHLDIIEHDKRPEVEAIHERHSRDFQAALCRPEISARILGKYFPDEDCSD